MADIYTLGEPLIVFLADDQDDVRTAKKYSISVAGAEVNVAVAATRLGLDVVFQTRVGVDQLGDVVLTQLTNEGVAVAHVTRNDAFTGALVRNRGISSPTNVTYLRKGSAASTMVPSDIDEATLASSKWLHVTGITAAISESAKSTLLKAIEIAKSNQVKISLDLNIRKKLWSDENARDTLAKIANEIDLIIGGVKEFELVFGSVDPELNLQSAMSKGVTLAIMTNGEGEMRICDHGNRFNFTPFFRTTMDPVGSGDAFAAGLLSGLIANLPLLDAIKQGSECGALTASQLGDWPGLPYGTKGIMTTKGGN
jgi:2-dehydro-3-deoxygluconokinase